MTKSWGGLSSSMQRKISTVIADKILWNCIEANNVWSCTMSFQSSLYTYSACDLHYSSALVVTSPLSIPIQTNWRLHSHSILSLISRPRSTHLQYGKCSHNITRDHWNETNLIIYSGIGKCTAVFNDRMLLCSLFSLSKFL